MTAIPGPLQSMVFRSEDLPALFHHTDAIAIARQREAVNTTRGQLILLVVGAVPAALPWHGSIGGSFQLLDAVGALAYLGVLVTTYVASRRKAKSHWQLNRSAAEFIKSMCWRYAVHGSPFDTGTQHPEAVFANRLEEGLQELRKVGWVDPRDEMNDAGSGLITESMRELRSRAFTVRKETYVRDRLIEQRRWYRRRQQVSRRGAFVWSSAIAALTTPALTLSLLQTFGTARSFALTGALSAAAAACLAWNEMRRHHPLISAHSLVEKDLESMQAAMETSLTERQWPVAVFETERIVSPEHTDWLARHRM
ncbi:MULTISPECIES: DUF4231 domain-containing protein [unclassified Streptomyces]|uniref:DUF4231 domain-containing protein n=1 Tax=unclassified Streptomyces TaxID=2593676 RepID=UPI0022585F9C|nr:MULTISPECIES: DUF4231 domain-containing protein [unclassified Streptomyces]MCX4536022.1 DUF4231 domain-containing protein [Streptomyces sp. NBC_01669]WRZ98722.1 DUF4231 domain-containing protein [Streptomyces sp. NBC_00841]